ncbi:hypothetical protein FHT40_004948 [Mycolicibacterium sp. BK556]|uniref:hypothetical protein n=1 Tax=unclassified Mycolicibacterium TaxID=2636767 RepID=UPI00160F56C4|nr:MULTISPECIES: hypothetical protein [unclassified Mycolicibacterium]MBB3605264.1 hypothetical protein [Mycolicibacterium sp. BK556]MBB3635460.1 hypothetical protein [Mycolicibacterium sp. BK607]
MLSRVIPLEYLKERDLMYWLPPGGVDNDVWADTWVIIAELESADVTPVLELLRDSDIGGYAARPRLVNSPGAGRQLYVDVQQYNKALDVLMLFLRQKEQPPMPRSEPIGPKIRSKIKVPAVPRAVALVLKVVVSAALIALFLFLVYTQGPRRWPGVHGVQHPAPTSEAPGIEGSTP